MIAQVGTGVMEMHAEVKADLISIDSVLLVRHMAGCLSTRSFNVAGIEKLYSLMASLLFLFLLAAVFTA